MKEEIKQRLGMLRKKMADAGIAAAIVPQADPHAGEYLASHWQARRFLSGFTGSAGTLVVLADKAFFWTDSRYFLQAADQLDGTDITLMKDGVPGTPSINDYICSHLAAGDKVGIDGMLLPLSEARAMTAAFAKRGILLDDDFDVLDQIWPDRPALPQGKIFVHDIKYAGIAAADKIAAVLERVEAQGADTAFISALDEIAWLLNIRADDVKYNPVATSFLYVAPAGKSVLLIDSAKLADDTTAYLAEQGVAVKDYSAVKDFLASLPAAAKVLIEPARTVSALAAALGSKAVEGASPVAMLKACKNDSQIAGVRAAMLRDGVAMVKSLMEIEQAVASGATFTELDVAKVLYRHRSQSPLFFDESFGTIAGYGPHGAIVHYEADEQSNATIHPNGLLLIDSGAQYLDGTTDITRTICLGTPTDLERRDFTLVMKGHIALAKMIFPQGTCGTQLDAIARRALWAEGLSYLHGTGHGVGHFLNVHEGPQSIRLNYVPAPMTPGMITSNEPGLYREGVHGIRCENLVLCVPAMTTDFGEFYKFETLTLCPFDRALFDTSIMTDEEIQWVNEYHTRVRSMLSPCLNSVERTWLEEKTAAL